MHFVTAMASQVVTQWMGMAHSKWMALAAGSDENRRRAQGQQGGRARKLAWQLPLRQLYAALT